MTFRSFRYFAKKYSLTGRDNGTNGNSDPRGTREPAEADVE